MTSRHWGGGSQARRCLITASSGPGTTPDSLTNPSCTNVSVIGPSFEFIEESTGDEARGLSQSTDLGGVELQDEWTPVTAPCFVSESVNGAAEFVQGDAHRDTGTVQPARLRLRSLDV